MITRDQFEVAVAAARLAPSTHNTQPARYELAADGAILVCADLTRHLPACDPEGRDLGVSCGAAAEGILLALAAHGLGARVEDLWLRDQAQALSGTRLAARITAGGAPDPRDADLAAVAPDRFTYRGTFAPVPDDLALALTLWADTHADVVLASDPADIAHLAALADTASVTILRDRAFRRELVDWMRLSPNHPRWSLDGMNLQALGMGRAEGMMAGLLMGGALYTLADRLGMAQALTGEAARTRSATAIALFCRPKIESPVTSGRAFYRIWLEITALGLVGWPMAAIGDDPDAAADTVARFAIPPGKRIVNTLRLGLPQRDPPSRARLDPADLVIRRT